MNNSLQNIYQLRHKLKRGKHHKLKGIFANERAVIFSKWIGTNKSVLDLGCRDCELTSKFANGNKVDGIDIDMESLSLCPKYIKTECLDLNSDWHARKENKYDFVVASEVIEHLYYPEKTVQKVHAVLNKNGCFIGSVPNAFNIKNRTRFLFGSGKNTPLDEPTHINHFSRKELLFLLKKYFSKVEIVPICRKQWQWFANIFPGLGSYLLLWRASK